MSKLDYKFNFGKFVRIFLINLLISIAYPELAAGQISTNGVYISKGKTTEVGTDIYSINPTNESTIIQFSNGLIGKVETNSDFQINSFFQDVENTGKNPEKAKFGQSALAVTLMEGNAYFVYSEPDSNSSCVVSTPFADIELHKGAFLFVVNTNNALCLVIDGSLVAHGEKKEEKKVEAGSALVCVPTVQGIFESKFSLSTQFINGPVLNKYKAITKDLSILPNSTIFIRIDGKTIGVTL